MAELLIPSLYSGFFFVVGISEAWFIFLRNKKFVCILYFIILQMKNIHKLGVRNQFVVRMV